MKKEICCNCVSIIGKVVTPIEYHHEYNGVKYFQFFVSIKRRSGVEDIIPVIITERLYKSSNIMQNTSVRINGQYLSYRNRVTRKIFLYVHAKELSLAKHDSYENSILLEGYVVSKGENRKTPFGKIVMEIKMTVYKEDGRFAYIPCIVWGLSDSEAESLKVNDKISVVGRIQSREYTKRYEDGKEEKKVAYEVSVSEYFKV